MTGSERAVTGGEVIAIAISLGASLIIADQGRTSDPGGAMT
jgi:hypothetical protein